MKQELKDNLEAILCALPDGYTEDLCTPKQTYPAFKVVIGDEKFTPQVRNGSIKKGCYYWEGVVRIYLYQIGIQGCDKAQNEKQNVKALEKFCSHILTVIEALCKYYDFELTQSDINLTTYWPSNNPNCFIGKVASFRIRKCTSVKCEDFGCLDVEKLGIEVKKKWNQK